VRKVICGRSVVEVEGSSKEVVQYERGRRGEGKSMKYRGSAVVQTIHKKP